MISHDDRADFQPDQHLRPARASVIAWRGDSNSPQAAHYLNCVMPKHAARSVIRQRRGRPLGWQSQQKNRNPGHTSFGKAADQFAVLSKFVWSGVLVDLTQAND